MEFWHHHGGVSVPDLEASIRWYGEVLGFEVEKRVFLASIPAKMAMLKNGDLRFELFEAQEAKPSADDRAHPHTDIRSHGNKHVSFAVADIDAMEKELRHRGANIIWLRRNPDNSAFMYLSDNAGNMLEFVEQPRHALRPATLTQAEP
jgi:methylmalonyl-CoA/ethylmalonyl-CoA epimerase